MNAFYLIVAIIICILWFMFRQHKIKNKSTESEQQNEPCPNHPEEDKKGSHPYQKLIDSLSKQIIREIEGCLKEGRFRTYISTWKETYPQPIKKAIIQAVYEHFKEYNDTLDFNFSEGGTNLRIEIVPLDKKKK